jgi:hypothetical protein
MDDDPRLVYLMRLLSLQREKDWIAAGGDLVGLFLACLSTFLPSQRSVILDVVSRWYKETEGIVFEDLADYRGFISKCELYKE